MTARSAQLMIDECDEVARLAQSAAVLMAAGLAPDRVWGYLGVSLAQIQARPQPSWRSLASGWAIATTVGAPMAQSMRRLATALREGAEVVRDVQTALAGPQSAGRLILFLPVAALGLGSLLGFNSLEVLFLRPVGWGCLLVAGVLIYGGARWSRSLTTRAIPRSWNPGLRAELMAMALGGGVSLDRAQRLVSQELAVPAAPTGSVQPAEPNTLELAGIARVLALADEAGVPAAELLRAEAEKQRYEARARGQRDAQRLGISLLLPLGLCILPAFVLVAVVPLIVAVLSSTSFGF
jgi:tight adherence protein B